MGEYVPISDQSNDTERIPTPWFGAADPRSRAVRFLVTRQRMLTAVSVVAKKPGIQCQTNIAMNISQKKL